MCHIQSARYLLKRVKSLTNTVATRKQLRPVSTGSAIITFQNLMHVIALMFRFIRQRVVVLR